MAPLPPSSVAVALDSELSVRVREARAAEHAIAVLLAQVQAGGHFRAFGYAKLADYAVDRHGITGVKRSGWRGSG